MIKVGIIDYGCGNLASLANALFYLGYKPEFLQSPSEAKNFYHLILPGVGAYAHGMKQLSQNGWNKYLQDYVQSRDGYFLGICLGMQLMCDSSDEDGFTTGLGLIPGKVTRLIPKQEEKVPHVGWNDVIIQKDNSLTRNIPNNTDFYFVHSYALQSFEEEYCLGTTDYSSSFASIVSYNNLVFGVQFHPEKSSKNGLQLLKNFIEMN
jgi:glutamine amidotransferase